MSALPPDRTPVIADIGEITDKPGELMSALEAIALMTPAQQRAASDTTDDGSGISPTLSQPTATDISPPSGRTRNDDGSLTWKAA